LGKLHLTAQDERTFILSTEIVFSFHVGHPDSRCPFFLSATELGLADQRLARQSRTGIPKVAGEGTTLMVPEKRVEHISVLRPDICTLDLNTMNSGNEVVINTPANVRRMAKVIAEVGVKTEIELFDSGDIALMRDLLADRTLQAPPLCSFVMGVRYGFRPAPETVLYARDLLPPDAELTAIGIGKAAFTTVAQSYLAGGHVRVGLEDAVYLSRGHLATSNTEMVAKARRIVEDLGGTIATFSDARQITGLLTQTSYASAV
jgi:3-dehydrocarnitine:acetyl-CoA trimethylamine transferase